MKAVKEDECRCGLVIESDMMLIPGHEAYFDMLVECCSLVFYCN